MGALWPSSRVYTLNASLHSSTGKKLLLLSVRWLKNQFCKVSAELADTATAIVPSMGQVQVQREWCGHQGAASTWAQTSREPCALRALSRPPAAPTEVWHSCLFINLLL